MDAGALNVIRAAQAIHNDLVSQLGPPEEGLPADTHLVVPAALVRKTRGYIEKVTNQANGCYEKGWYDAAAVMVRRLLETLIIEAFEHHKIASKIKKGDDFLYLRDLINATLSESTWNLSRNTRSALPKLKDIGDKSAHSRYYNAVRDDLAPLLPDIRMCVQELTHHAGLK